MVGWITVAPEGFEDDADLDTWVDLGVTFAAGLPAK
jgi:hypothetical protein